MNTSRAGVGSKILASCRRREWSGGITRTALHAYVAVEGAA
jgi:hypothetical protein